ncbi:hypothetical protein, partial [Kingella kingae]|uniref:hypothetical protein n=1 Tax=Kingella kingae TaxID=504 RepID=UPI0018AD4C8B
MDLVVLHWGDISAYSSANFGRDMGSLHRDLGDMLHTGLLSNKRDFTPTASAITHKAAKQP